MEEKIIFIVIGIALGKIADIAIQKYKTNSLEEALLEELEDIREHLEGILKFYDRTLQGFALGGFNNEVSLKLYNPIFTKHYVDVALKLNASQRKSFSFIQAYVDNVNKGLDRLESTLRNTDHFTEEVLEEWGETLHVQYETAAQTLWHVNYHIRNKEHPFIGGADSSNFKAKKEYLEGRKTHVEKLIEGAREHLSRDDFE